MTLVYKTESILWPGPDMVPRTNQEPSPEPIKPACSNPDIVNVRRLYRQPDYFYDFGSFIP